MEGDGGYKLTPSKSKSAEEMLVLGTFEWLHTECLNRTEPIKAEHVTSRIDYHFTHMCSSQKCKLAAWQ